MMRHRFVVALATGSLLAAGAAFAVPALAAGSPSPGTPGGGPVATGSCPMGGPAGQGRAGQGMGGRGMGGQGMGGQGMGGQGMGGGGRWGGSGADPLAGLARGTLTDGQKRSLAGMAEEEKLAHDVYVVLAARSGDVRFTHVATAESRHLAQVRALLTRYGVTDPTAGKAEGAFTTEAVQRQYTDLVARGSASRDAAAGVGREIEKADVAALATARTGLTAPDVLAVYDRLTRGSQMHLRAFGG